MYKIIGIGGLVPLMLLTLYLAFGPNGDRSTRPFTESGVSNSSGDNRLRPEWLEAHSSPQRIPILNWVARTSTEPFSSRESFATGAITDRLDQPILERWKNIQQFYRFLSILNGEYGNLPNPQQVLTGDLNKIDEDYRQLGVVILQKAASPDDPRVQAIAQRLTLLGSQAKAESEKQRMAEENRKLLQDVASQMEQKEPDWLSLQEKLKAHWLGESTSELESLQKRCNLRLELKGLERQLKLLEEAMIQPSGLGSEEIDEYSNSFAQFRRKLESSDNPHPEDQVEVNELAERLNGLVLRNSFGKSWKASGEDLAVWLPIAVDEVKAKPESEIPKLASQLLNEIVKAKMEEKKSRLPDVLKYAQAENGRLYEGVFEDKGSHFRYWTDAVSWQKDSTTGFERKPKNFFKTVPQPLPELTVIETYNAARARLIANPRQKSSWEFMVKTLKEGQSSIEQYTGSKQTTDFGEQIAFCETVLQAWDQFNFILD
jgi:hypothetical protein